MKETDAEDLLQIYCPIVQNTPISFEVTSPNESELCSRISKILNKYPWLVFQEGGEILGYAYGSDHRSREAYQWCVETSVYVAPSAHRKRVGTKLYQALLAILRAQGFFNVYAGISLPNQASVKFHEAQGFKPVGIYPQIGFKRERWHDVGWWQLRLIERTNAPLPPLYFGELLSRNQDLSVYGL